MSNSQEQSLDEHAVFAEVPESSPEFLYSEWEREALERLLSAGPDAFYGSVGAERSGCFLSPQEVRQVSGWAQDYRFSRPQREEHGGGGTGTGSHVENSTYFPCNSDTPAPDLDLGWPERGPWLSLGSVKVHTSPPADGDPPLREIIRLHLQKATRVVAVVTDALTDGAIMGDLHGAASRGVPVYIILNHRSTQDNFTLNRLQHPNLRVRVLGGKSFCSRTGRMVVGEMKDKFLLVDLETVIHGSYSLSWTDAHLHRQLITVLQGPVVESFDREFRILFAASLPVPVPVPESPRAAKSHVAATHALKDLADLRPKKQRYSLDTEIINPPSPPPDSFLDWEAMGVLHRNNCPGAESPAEHQEEPAFKEILPRSNMIFNKNSSFLEDFTFGNHFLEKRRPVFDRMNITPSPVTNHVPDRSTTFNNIKSSPVDSTPEWMTRVERIVERTMSRQLPQEKKPYLDERMMLRVSDVTTEANHNSVLSSSTRRERSRRDFALEEESGSAESGPRVENKPSSRKPLILRLPPSEGSTSLSDIMKRIQPKQSSSQLLRTETSSTLSQSMMDLSVHSTDSSQEGRVPVPRFKASGLDPGYVTPAFALMKKRNDDLKSSLFRTPAGFLPRDRPRSSAFTLDWRRSLAERETGDLQ